MARFFLAHGVLVNNAREHGSVYRAFATDSWDYSSSSSPLSSLSHN